MKKYEKIRLGDNHVWGGQIGKYEKKSVWMKFLSFLFVFL